MEDSVIVFFDTNVYLHYQMFDQVDWRKMLQAKTVRIVVPPITIRELNRIKDTSPQSHIRERAGKVLKRFAALFSESDSEATVLREGVDILFHPDDPLIDFAAHHLSREVQDDQLMAAIIAYQQESGRSDVLLVTADAGVLMLGKARRHGIRTITCLDNLKLPEQPTPEQLQIRKLQAEVDKLRNRLPKLHLEFESGNNRVEFMLAPVPELTGDELEKKMDEVKQKHPKKSAPPPITRSEKEIGTRLSELMAAIQLPQNMISQADIAAYNEELDRYYERHEKYLRDLRAYEKVEARLIRLDICLANTGTAPAEDIDISMHFPDGFAVLSEEDVPERPRPPAPPSPPKSAMERMMEAIQPSIATYPHLIRPDLPSIDPPPNVSAPYIRRTNSYDVSVNVGKIKHKSFERLDPLFILFDSLESAASFTITYSLLADDLPDEIHGELHVVIKK